MISHLAHVGMVNDLGLNGMRRAPVKIRPKCRTKLGLLVAAFITLEHRPKSRLLATHDVEY